MLLACGLAVTWKFSPSFREKVFIAGLANAVPPLQKLCAIELREYPTKLAAISLIIFANLHNPYRIDTEEWRALVTRQIVILAITNDAQRWPEKYSAEQLRKIQEKLPEFQKELREIEEKMDVIKRAHAPQIKKKREVTEEALISLCYLSGHTFGSYFERSNWGHSWGSLDEQAWEGVMREINSWALVTLVPQAFSAITSLLQCPQDQEKAP